MPALGPKPRAKGAVETSSLPVLQEEKGLAPGALTEEKTRAATLLSEGFAFPKRTPQENQAGHMAHRRVGHWLIPAWTSL